MELSESRRQEIIDKVSCGEPLPADFKHLLFPPERQEYELVYADKMPEQDVLAGTMALPLQPIRSFGSGESDNRLIFGDNLQALKALLRLKQEGGLRNPDGTDGFKLIYLDPPFATTRDFAADTEEVAYADKVVGARFVEFLRRRLILMRELLAPNAT